MYDHLFQPIDVGPITIPNRVVRSAHSTALPLKRLIAYHEARAVGGVGMSTLEATGVHLSSPAMRSIIPLHDDSVIPFYRELTDALRPHGMKMLQQIYHPGSARAPGKGTTQVSASAIPNPLVGGTPLEMTKPMIEEMVEAFASAARRCRDGGLDGVDIHASSGYLIEQFLSPANNVRTDEYGGSLENRMRFLMEVIHAIRDEVGNDICVGIRLPNEEYIPGGLTAADNAQIAHLVEPHVDYISLHMGSYWRFHKLLSPMDDPLGHEMPANEPIIKRISKPTIVVGPVGMRKAADSAGRLHRRPLSSPAALQIARFQPQDACNDCSLESHAGYDRPICHSRFSCRRIPSGDGCLRRRSTPAGGRDSDIVQERRDL